MAESLVEKYDKIERTREEERRRNWHASVAECAETLFALAQERGEGITIKAYIAEHLKTVSIEYDKKGI